MAFCIRPAIDYNFVLSLTVALKRHCLQRVKEPDLSAPWALQEQEREMWLRETDLNSNTVYVWNKRAVKQLSAKTGLQQYFHVTFYSAWTIFNLCLYTIKPEELGIAEPCVIARIQVVFIIERQKWHLTILITRFIDEPWIICEGSVNVSHLSWERRVEFTSSFHTFQGSKLIWNTEQDRTLLRGKCKGL